MKDSLPEDLYRIPAFTKEGNLHAVIEVPAGTNVKWEYQPDKKEFSAKGGADKPRVVEFLPYPSNYGFVPSTMMHKEAGGDGDPIDIIVLAESKPRGSLLEVVPLAILRLLDDGQQDHKILSIPVKESERLISASALHDVPEAVLQILEIWFLNYKGREGVRSNGWANEKEAIKEVKRWFIA